MKKIFLLLFITQCLWNIVSSQGVGIGTATPSSSAILDIKSSTKGLLFPRTSTTSRLAMSGVKGLMVYDTTLSQLYYHTGSAWMNVATGTIPPTYWTAIGSNIYDTNSGNIGIGTTFPIAKLEVEGDFMVEQGEGTIYSDAPVFKIDGTADAVAARLRFSLPNDDPDFAITQALGNLYISRYIGTYGFATDLMVDNTGYVGVGVADPLVRLHVDGGTDVGNASGGFLQLGAGNSLNVGFDNNEIQARNNGVVSRLVLNNGGGAVQIGSAVTPTGYSFSVNGKAICEELKIQDSSNWPDYVFHHDYKLESLGELREYIKENNHLPNIPSAVDVEKDGIEIGDMQKRMMEKIEELTLYVLQLEEKTKNLETEIAALKH